MLAYKYIGNYHYDNSNRLLYAQNINQGDYTYSVFNTYDKDGNLTTLKRYGDHNILADNFIYTYSPGTNKLTRVSSASDQFGHDLNGNTILDELNGYYNILYDHRNLITELYHIYPNSETPYTTATRYYYDESGNRVRKLTYFNTQYDPLPVIDWNNLKNPGNNWQLLYNEFYVKGADGKDLATYEGQELQKWYVWGNDIAGKLKGDKAYYYYKDHLGSVRVVVNNTGAIVAGYDYDAWGYPLENRNYNGDSIKFKYTGKELDKESFYDYFGARYYDARIGRWGVPDAFSDFEPSLNPYHYTNNNPLKYIDPNGLDYFFYLPGSNSNGIRILNPGEDQYYFYNTSGDYSVNSSGDYSFLNGLTFYKASSKSTKDFYFSNTNTYSPDDISIEFESSQAKELVNNALSNSYSYLPYDIINESRDMHLFDYKQYLNASTLYLFNGNVYNKEEAGNVLWGITMAHFGVPSISALLGADMYTIFYTTWESIRSGKNSVRRDEQNEQIAILKGYYYYGKNPF